MKEQVLAEYTRLCRFVKNRPLLCTLIASCLFIVFVIGASFYANVLVYNYATLNGHPTGMGVHQSVIQTLVQYDGLHYTQIAHYGYRSKTDAAFFPLYPLSIRLVARLTKISYAWSALVVAWVAFCGAMLLLYKWLELELTSLHKKLSVWLPLGIIAIFPTSFYFVLPYTESLFLLLNVGTFYSYRKGNYALATLCAALAACTHTQGLLLGVYFAADYAFSKQRNRYKLIPIVGAIIGFLLYALFLHIHYGSPFAFLTAEKSWGRLHGNYLLNLLTSLRPLDVWYLLILGIGLASVFHYLGRAYFLYTVLFTLFPIASGSFVSSNRYMVSAVPLFLGLALLSEHTPRVLKLLFVCSSSFIFTWSLLLFANGYWVG